MRVPTKLLPVYAYGAPIAPKAGYSYLTNASSNTVLSVWPKTPGTLADGFLIWSYLPESAPGVYLPNVPLLVTYNPPDYEKGYKGELFIIGATDANGDPVSTGNDIQAAIPAGMHNYFYAYGTAEVLNANHFGYPFAVHSGVDGTIGEPLDALYDNDNLYLCAGTATVTDISAWKKIPLQFL